MELEFNITKNDYENFHKKHFINALKDKIAPAILIPIFIGYSFGGLPFSWMKFIISTIITSFLYLAIFYLIPYFVSINKLKRDLSIENGNIDRKKLSITEDGIFFVSGTSSIMRKWDCITSINSTDMFVFLRLADKRIYLIPKSAFITNDDLISFVGIIQNEIAKRKGDNNATENTNPPYKRGLICLIPIVGVYAGIVFIFQGIFKYKDKWFTLMGIFGILFTVVLYGTLFPELWNTKINNEKNIEISKIWMTNLIKDIEFYKIQNGKYPESLDEINNYSSYDPIYDINDKNNSFNYKLIGEKYLLFSSGVDRIPNTKDDIYPEIQKNKSTKIGLYKYKLKTVPQ